MDSPFPRAVPFSTAGGVDLWAVPLPAGEVPPLGSAVPSESEGVLLVYRDGARAGEEQITFALSSVRSYAELSGINGSVNYSGADMARLAALIDEELGRIATISPPGPRSRLSPLALRLA